MKQFVKTFLLVFFGVMFLLSMTGTNTQLFSFLNIPRMPALFADIRAIPPIEEIGNVAALRIENPFDPFNRPYNYPSIWIIIMYLLSVLGNPVYVFGWVVTSLMVTLYIRLLTTYWNEYYKLILTFIVAFSPPVMLLLERGNNDSVMLLLLLFSFYNKGFVSGLSLGIASVLKLFPILFFPALFLLRKNSTKSFLAGFSITIPLMIWSFLDYSGISGATPSPDSTAFGLKSMALIAKPWFNSNIGLFTVELILLAVILVFALMFIYLLRNTFRLPEYKDLFSLESADLLIFFGSGFVLIFILGAHFAYRVVFGIPLLYALIDFVRSRTISGVFRWYSPTLIGLFLIQLWSPVVIGHWDYFAIFNYLFMLLFIPYLIAIFVHTDYIKSFFVQVRSIFRLRRTS